MAQVEQVVTELVLDGVSEFERGMQDAGSSTQDLADSMTSMTDELWDTNAKLDELIEVMTRVADSAEPAAEETDNINDSLEETSNAAEKAGNSFDVFGEIAIGALREIGAVSVNALGALADAALNVAGSAIQGLQGFLSDAVSEAIEGEKNLARLEQVIKSTGGAAGLTSEEAQALAQQFAGLAGGSDDAILAIEELGLRMGTISADEMPAFIQQSLDLGTVMGSNEAAARLLARAQEDPLGVMGQLRRAGILFTEEQENQIKTMVEAGDTAGAYDAVMAQLASTTGGAAAANAETFAGKMELMNGRLGEAAESIGAAFLPVLEDLFVNVIEPALPVIEQFALDIANAISAFAESSEAQAAMEMLESVIRDISEFFGVFTIALQDGKDPLDAIGIAIRAAFPPEVESLLMSIYDAVVEFVGFIEESWPAIETAGQGVIDFINGTLIPGFEDLVSWTEENWPGIQTTIEEVMTFISNIISGVLTDISAWWTEHGDEIMETVGEFMTFVQDKVNEVLTAVKTWWEEHGDSVTEVITNLVDGIKKIWGEWFTFLYDKVMEVLGLVKTFWDTWGDDIEKIVGAIFEAIGDVFDAFALAFEGDWTGFGEKLREAWDGVWTAIQEAAQKVFDWFGEQDWGAIAQGIIDGIISGIETGGAALNEALQNMAKNALDAAKGFLGIQSPSKLFASQVGEQISAGMAEGILAGASDVVDAAAQTAGAATDAAQIAIGGSSVSASPVASSARAMMPPQSNVNKTVNVYPNYSKYQTPPEVAFDVELALAAM